MTGGSPPTGPAAPTREAELRAIVRKLDRRLLPFLLLMYVLAFLDRTNVGFAKTAFQASTGIGEASYALGASIFFVGYALLEVPSNILLTRFGARIWLARIMVTWGLISAAMLFVRGETSFYLLRLLLGIAEAGFFPGVVFYLTQFYPAEYRARALGIFYVGAPLSFILGGPVSGLLLTLDGRLGLQGWQWLFMVEGLLTALVGVAAFFALADDPATTKWLGEAEKRLLAGRLSPQGAAAAHHGSLLQALRAPVVLSFGTIFLIVQASVYGLVFFMPSQIAGLLGRQVGPLVGMVSALPWLASLAATLVLPRAAEQFGRRVEVGAILFVGAGLGLAGSALLAGGVPVMLSLSLAAASFIAVQPIFWAIASSHLPAGHRAASIALVNSLGALGSFLAPNLRVALDRLFAAPGAGVLGLAGLALVGGVLLARMRGRASRG